MPALPVPVEFGKVTVEPVQNGRAALHPGGKFVGADGVHGGHPAR